jgi:predicted nucleic acid-binding protein
MTLAWALADEQSERTDALLRWSVTRSILVPAGWLGEVVNGLLVAERRQRITPLASRQFLVRLRSLTIMVDDQIVPAVWLDLARRHRLTAYDAAYLELALRLELPLATLDMALSVAAREAGLAVLETAP